MNTTQRLTHRQDQIRLMGFKYKQMDSNPSDKKRLHKEIDTICKGLIRYLNR